MRRAAKIDANQTAIVSALRAAGASVQSLAAVGDGVPDFLVGFRGVNFTLECKDGNQPPSKQRLTADQVKWHAEWRGAPVVVVNSPEAALRAIGAVGLRIEARFESPTALKIMPPMVKIS